MDIKRKVGVPFGFLVLFSLLIQLNANLSPAEANYEVKVGVILDMGSWTGKNIFSGINMALSDYYISNILHRTRIVLHPRDSMGDPIQAISAALDLVENVKVKVIIGPETPREGKLLAVIGSKFKVPIFSFSSILSSPRNDSFLVQIKQDETLQFKGISALMKSYQWRTVNIIYEDVDDGREILSHLFDPLREANIHIAHLISISPFCTDDQILNDLRELHRQPTTSAITLVHMSPSLASRVFPIAKRLGMMKEEYAWIITDKTMNHFHMLDSEVIEPMQGALGFKAYIPSSSRLRDITLRWRKEFYSKDPSMELIKEVDVLGIWAYDTLWALAESVERVDIESDLDGKTNQSNGLISLDNLYWGKRLLDEIARTRIRGLSGEFQILNGKLHTESYIISNVLGKGDRRIGFWTPEDGMVKEIKVQHPSSRRGLEAVIWPGGSATVPKGWFSLNSGKKLRIAVVNSGFKELVNVHLHPQTNEPIVTGFCKDVFVAAIESLDYEVPYEFIPFVDENGVNFGSYADLIKQVYLQKYDGAVGDITITANRSLYVDFTMPYTDLGVGTITRRENNDIWIFSKPLQTKLWLTSAAFFVLLGLVVWIIEHGNNMEFQGSVTHQIGTILWFGFSTLVYAHREKLTSNLSRFVVILWLFVVLILTSSYTATLSSMLTVQQIQLASVRQYIGVQNGSFLGGIVSSNLNFKDDRLQQYTSAEEYADALSRGSKKGGVSAIVDEIPYIKVFLAKYGAHYAMVSSTLSTNGFGFVFQKGSPQLVSDISGAIMKLREKGNLAMMEKTWFRNQSSSFMPDNVANSSAEPNRLSLDNFGGLFLLSFVSSILALLLHLIFLLKKKLQQHSNSMLSGEKYLLAIVLSLRFLAARNNESRVEPVNADQNGEQELQDFAGSIP
ncbi:hypothetical protein M9H77_01098 [Catharanthus roseus]|uniref:Uncharacterized protein n=1 Tax=Catharanthus roseus TaxID=4058 RepID=A0ACC0C506_CATRO|nr:hypothetical protein M9H77_01098 [Catharanthus roseus]